MLKVGVIGYGGRGRGMIESMDMYGIPFEVAAITDPRGPEIRASDPKGLLTATRFYTDADVMLDSEKLDGVFVGTNCHLHTPMACKVAARNLPLFLEKPVAISFEQLRELQSAFAKVTAPVVVSFPLRLSPLVQKAREIIAAGIIGAVDHVVAWNDVPYGSVYYNSWYRDYELVQGLFLQKATHDFDYIFHLLDQKPKWVCAMKSQRIYGGDKPWDLVCEKCDERETCPESPVTLFHERFQGDRVNYWAAGNHCCFSKGIRHEDSGNAILEFENGVQASYSQNFFARNNAGRRGARLFGYKGTLEFEWYTNTLKVHSHRAPSTETLTYGGNMSHFGGDRELILDFLLAMRDGKPTRTGIQAGIMSALTCLCARQSAETRQFVEIKC